MNKIKKINRNLYELKKHFQLNKSELKIKAKILKEYKKGKAIELLSLIIIKKNRYIKYY